MKRFGLVGVSLVVSVGTLSSCAQVSQFTQSRGTAKAQISRKEVPVESLRDVQAASPLESELSRETKAEGRSQRSKLAALFSRRPVKSAKSEASSSASSPSIALAKINVTPKAGVVRKTDLVNPTTVAEETDQPQATPKLVQTAFVQKLPLEVPPAPFLQNSDAPVQNNEASTLQDEMLELKPVPGGAGLLSLNDLEQMALDTNPTLQQAAAVVAKARGIHLQVGLYPNPTVGYVGTEIGDSDTAGQQGGFIGQTIVTGDKLKLNRAVADWDIEALSWEYQAQRYRVLNDVRLRYFEVLGSQRRVSIGEDLVGVAETGVKTAKDLFEAKQGARPDVLQAQVDLNAVQIILQNARFDLEAAWKQLAAVLGQPELPQAQLAGTLQEEVPTYEWEATYAELLENSPVLQAANMRVQRAITQIRRQEAQPIPNLQTQFSAARDNLSNSNEVNVQVGISLPIFNRNQGNIALAQSEHNRAVRDVERLQLSLRNQLAGAFRDMQQSDQQVVRYRKDIIPTAKENLDLTEEGYKQGEFDFLRVLTARRTYFETNLRYVQSLIALRQANVILSGLLLTGGLNDVRNISPGAVSGAGGLRGAAVGGQQ